MTVMLLFEESVVLAAIVVIPVPDVVVVRGAPLKATVPPPLNVRFVLTGVVTVKLPPAPVEMVPVLPAPGPVIVRSSPLPFTLIAEAPVAAIVEPLPRNARLGVLTVTAPPPAIVSVIPEPTVIEAPAVWAANVVDPAAPALNVCAPVNARALAPATVKEIAEAPPPVSVTLPVPLTVRGVA